MRKQVPLFSLIMKNNPHKICFAFVLAMGLSCTGFAQGDSVKDNRFKTGLKKYYQSLVHGNVDRTFEKKMDFTWLAFPTYSQEGSFGLMATAVALYRIDRNDSAMSPSNLQFTGKAFLKGIFSFSMEGNNSFKVKGTKTLLVYDLYLADMKLDFWGIDYAACAVNEKSSYDRRQVQFFADYTAEVLRNTHLGVGVVANATEARNIGNTAYLEGQKTHYAFGGISGILQYDSRDFIPNAKRGVFAKVKATVYPQFMSDYNKTLLSFTVQFDAYHKLWKNAVLAYDLQGIFNSTATPWTLREQLGYDCRRMRGYYSGCYIDNNYVSAQIELRQHLFWRIGMVAWGGGGYIFPSLKAFDAQKFLYNCGLGLRVEVKKNFNMRVDCGFGKDNFGVVIRAGEAF